MVVFKLPAWIAGERKGGLPGILAVGSTHGRLRPRVNDELKNYEKSQLCDFRFCKNLTFVIMGSIFQNIPFSSVFVNLAFVVIGAFVRF